MTWLDRAAKRTLDVAAAVLGMALLGWLILVFVWLARRETGLSGLFRQQRIGKQGQLFLIYKLRTMRPVEGFESTTTVSHDPRITPLGRFARRWKIDELPQLLNVLKGEMSLVGPRPDVPRYLERVRRDAPLMLSVRPGITGPASLKYRHEEELLAAQDDPETYNDTVIFTDKLRINEEYVRTYSFRRDLGYIWQTIVPRRQHAETAQDPSGNIHKQAA
jgi:lipopolysaccharide/colanic/teichoic acid biosynthesis glycosyltransferase